MIVLAPSAVVPSLNITVPVGVPVPLTVAVNITDWPTLLGFTEDANVTVELPLCTVCVNAVDVLDSKFVSPL